LRVGEQGIFESQLPAEVTLVGVLPACYEVLDLKTNGTNLELVLFRVDAVGEPVGADPSGGSTTAFANAPPPTAESAGSAWSVAQGLTSAFDVVQTAVIGTMSAAQLAGGTARSGPYPYAGFSTPSIDLFRWLTTSTAMSTPKTSTGGLGHYSSAMFRSEAVAGFSLTSGVLDPSIGLARTTWRIETTHSSFYSPITELNRLNSNLNASLSRSWRTWSGSTDTSPTWRPPKGIQATAKPTCDRWNHRLVSK
jgi:hypothetical protein